MLKLINFELKRNKITTYVAVSLILCAIMIALPYFVSTVAKVENEVEFQSYANIFKFTGVMSMVMFSILSSVMYSRFIIDEYSGNRLLLLFSYPVSRKKILMAKILLVLLFTAGAMTFSNIASIVIFSITESISSIVQDTLSVELILGTVKTMIISSLTVSVIGILAMRIGFIKKSVPSTIVAAFILTSIYGNAVVSGSDNNLLSISLLGFITILGIITVIELLNKVNKMEVE